MIEYLESTDTIDWDRPEILSLARILSSGANGPVAVARNCFEWVRDEVLHSVDHRRDPVTCSASEVLRHRTGFCYAKSHLLAALLRANAIPAGFCYQRLSLDDQGQTFCLHGLNAVHLPAFGWYRIDPRGNRPGIEAAFDPPHERLAFTPRLDGEADLTGVLAAPLTNVIQALRNHRSVEELLENLPDLLQV